jgi:hypothetical protein
MMHHLTEYERHQIAARIYKILRDNPLGISRTNLLAYFDGVCTRDQAITQLRELAECGLAHNFKQAGTGTRVWRPFATKIRQPHVRHVKDPSADAPGRKMSRNEVIRPGDLVWSRGGWRPVMAQSLEDGDTVGNRLVVRPKPEKPAKRHGSGGNNAPASRADIRAALDWSPLE